MSKKHKANTDAEADDNETTFGMINPVGSTLQHLRASTPDALMDDLLNIVWGYYQCGYVSTESSGNTINTLMMQVCSLRPNVIGGNSYWLDVLEKLFYKVSCIPSIDEIHAVAKSKSCSGPAFDYHWCCSFRDSTQEILQALLTNGFIGMAPASPDVQLVKGQVVPVPPVISAGDKAIVFPPDGCSFSGDGGVPKYTARVIVNDTPTFARPTYLATFAPTGSRPCEYTPDKIQRVSDDEWLNHT